MKKTRKKHAQVVDVLSHDLVPEMKIITEAETKKVLKKFEIDEDQLPKILSSDPAVVALKAAAGDVIRIERQEPTGKHIVYKVVI